MNRIQPVSHHLLRRTARSHAKRLNRLAPGDTEYRVEPSVRGPSRWSVVMYREALPE